MAKMYPPTFPLDKRNDPKFRAEALVYDEFSERLPDSWLVFYDVDILRPHNRVTADGEKRQVYDDAQADFVVAHPDHGFLVLEVKGGSVYYTDSWFSRNKEGDHSIKNPFSQARSCKHSLYKHLCAFFEQSRLPIPSGHGAIFPDIAHKSQLGVEAFVDQIIVETDWESIESKLVRMLEFSRYGYDGDLETRAVCIEGLEKMLAGTKSFEAVLSVRISQNKRTIRRLTEKQAATLNRMKGTRKLVISGCAGSGKTALALLKARQAAQEGKRVLLTCYNQKLGDYFHDNLADTEGITAVHFHELCREMGRAAALPLVAYPQSDKSSQSGKSSLTDEIYNSEYPMVLEAAMRARPDLRFDAVIVDEGQDFPEFWWIALSRSLRDDAKSLFYWFYDEGQAIFQPSVFVPPYEASLHLDENLRNTREIHDVLTPLYPNRAMQSLGPSGPPVRWAFVEDAVSMYEELGRQLSNLVREEGISPQDIAILTPNAERNSKLYNAQAAGFTFAARPAAKNEILTSTIHSFKGLERTVIILAELNDEKRVQSERYRQLVFLGASRAQQLLSFIGSPQVLESLQRTVHTLA